MGTNTQCSSLWIWRDCDVHGTVNQAKTKTWARVLQRYLAWQMYIYRRVLHWHRRKNCTLTYSQTTCRYKQIRCPIDEHHHWHTMESYTTNGFPASVHTTTNTGPNTATSPGRAITTGRSGHKQSANISNKAHHRHKCGRHRSKEGKDRYSKEAENGTTTAKHGFNIYSNTLNFNEVGNITNANRFTNQTSGRSSTWRKCKQKQKTKCNTTSINKTRRNKRERQYKTKNENQCSYSSIEKWQEDYNSNEWRPTRGTSRTKATRAPHLQQWRIRYREIEARNAKRNGINENTRRVRRDRCYKSYTTAKTRAWPQQHHWVKMGLQIKRRWSTSKDRSKRLHRTHRRPRRCVRQYTTFRSATDTPST